MNRTWEQRRLDAVFDEVINRAGRQKRDEERIRLLLEESKKYRERLEVNENTCYGI